MRRAHYALLVALREDGPASQAALGRRLAADRSDMHRTVGELESRGLIAREPDPEDRRRNVVTLTGARRRGAGGGRRAGGRGAGGAAGAARPLSRALPSSSELLSRVLERARRDAAPKSERPAEAGRPGGGEILLCDGSVSVGSMREVRVLLPLARRSSMRRQAICPMHAHRRVMSITGAARVPFLAPCNGSGSTRSSPSEACSPPVHGRLPPCWPARCAWVPAANGRRSRVRWSRRTSTSPSTTAHATSPGAGRSSPTRSTRWASTSPIARRSTPARRPEASPTCCCSAARTTSSPSTSPTASSTGACATTTASPSSSARTSAR